MRLRLYVLHRTLVGITVALMIAAGVVLLVNLVEVSRMVAGRSDLPVLALFEFALLKSPAALLQLLPFACLFGALGAFVVLNRRSELIAMRTAGLSAWSLVLPSGAAALLLGVFAGAVLNPLAATLNGRFEDRKTALAESGPERAGREIWFRQGGPTGQYVVRAEERRQVGDSIRLRHVSVFVQQRERKDPVGFDRRIEADEAVLLAGQWRLSTVREMQAGGETLRAQSLVLPSSLEGPASIDLAVTPAAVSLWRLPAAIASAERAGYPSRGYRLRLQQLLAAPLLLAGMTMLAAAFSLRLARLGDLARFAGLGLALGFMIYFANQLLGALCLGSVLPVGVAAWAAPVLSNLMAVTLLCYTEDG